MSNSEFTDFMEMLNGFLHDADVMNDPIDAKMITDRVIMILVNLCHELHNELNNKM
jgi:hypothetical protein